LSARHSKSSRPEQAGLPKVDSDRLAELGEALRQRYQDIESEPIPETLKILIDLLKESDRKKGADD
jgi:anti-sigma factor NepR-like protein